MKISTLIAITFVVALAAAIAGVYYARSTGLSARGPRPTASRAIAARCRRLRDHGRRDKDVRDTANFCQREWRGALGSCRVADQ